MIVLKALGFVVVWILLTCLCSFLMAAFFGGLAYSLVAMGLAHSEIRVEGSEVWLLFVGPAVMALGLTAAVFSIEGRR